MSGSYQPEIYDLFQPSDVAGDLQFYVEEARGAGGPVLELGAGTGRVALELARVGVSVTALELDADMRARLEDKRGALGDDAAARLSVVAGDMRAFALPQRFARVLIAFRTFLHNLTRDDQQACLRCALEHLAPGGKLVLNVFHPSLEVMARHVGALEGVWRLRGERELPDGGRVLRQEARFYDTVQQRVRARQRYERFDADGLLVETRIHFLELAYLYPSQLEQLLADAGFVDVRVHGGFDRRPFSDDMDELVVEGTRPPDGT